VNAIRNFVPERAEYSLSTGAGDATFREGTLDPFLANVTPEMGLNYCAGAPAPVTDMRR